jgi:hypothetical protein
MPEEREEGRTCWRSWNPLLIFLVLNRMLISWQACRKRGRKGGHAGGAGIHCFFSLFSIECCFLGRHAGREGGREDTQEELESIASFPYFE